MEQGNYDMLDNIEIISDKGCEKMIEIITARHQNHVFDEMVKRINVLESNIVLVPDQITVQTEMDLIQSLEIEGLIYTEVLSFRRFFDRLFDRMNWHEEHYVDNQGKIMLMRKILEENHKGLGVFSNAWRKDGFLLEMVKLMDEFRRNEITLADLERCQEKGSESRITVQKFSDIRLIMAKYEDYFKSDFKDEVAYYNRAVEAIHRLGKLEEKIWIIGFDGFTALEYRILKALFENGNQVALMLQWDEAGEDEVFQNLRLTLARLEKLAEESHQGLEKISIDSQRPAHALEYIGKAYYNYQLAPLEKATDRLSLSVAQSLYEEVDQTAIEMMGLTQQGYRWRDMAVLINDMADYHSILSRVFKEYNIPYFLDEKRSINNNSVVIAMMSLINICLYNYRYEDIFKYLKTDLFGHEKELIDVLENYILRYGIKGYKWHQDFYYESKYLELLNDMRREIVTPIENFRKKVKKKDTINQYIAGIRDYFEEIGLEQLIANRKRLLEEKEELEILSEYDQVYGIIDDLLTQIQSIIGDMEVELKTFRNMMQTGLAEYEVGVIPTTIDQVLVGNIDRIKHRKNKIVFILGAKDGAFPREVKDKGILLDIEKQVIKDLGLPLFSDMETITVEENMALMKVFYSAREKLYLSYSVADLDGKTLRPSVVFGRIKELLPLQKIEAMAKAENQLSVAKPTYKKLIGALRDYIDENTMDEDWKYVYKWYSQQPEWAQEIQNLEHYLFFENKEESISMDKIRYLYQKPYKTDASNIQKYIACPFSHFIRYGLKPEERKEYLIQAPEIGMFFHSSLERISKKINEEKLNWRAIEKADIERLVDETVNEIAPEFAHQVFFENQRNQYALKKLRRICQRVSDTLVDHVKNGSFEPSFFEAYFTNFNISLENGETIQLEGRIDRIDIDEEEGILYLKIIDYKSGNKAFKLAEAFHGIELQLLLYLEASMEMMQRKFPTKEVRPAGSLYFKIDDPMVEITAENAENIEREIKKQLKMTGLVVKDLKVLKRMDMQIESNGKSDILPVAVSSLKEEVTKTSTAYDYEEIAGLMDNTKALIKTHVSKLLEGHIEIKPYEYKRKKPCDYCEYSEICLFDKKFGNEYRKLKDLKDDDILALIKKED